MNIYINVPFQYYVYPKSNIVYYNKITVLENNEPACADWSPPNNDPTNIKAIRNFVNVSKGRKPKNINSLMDYNHNQKNECLTRRNSHRLKQVKRLEKERVKNIGVFQILDSGLGPKQDINQMIAITVKQKRLEAKQMKKHQSLRPIPKHCASSQRKCYVINDIKNKISHVI